MQRVSAAVTLGASAAQELTQRAAPAARTALQRALERNKAFVRDEPPRVLAKQLAWTSMARCAPRGSGDDAVRATYGSFGPSRASGCSHHQTQTRACNKLRSGVARSLDAELPVRYAHLRREWAAVRGAARNWRNLSLGEVGTAAAFSAECFAWFCVGEIVGRGGTLTGYAY